MKRGSLNGTMRCAKKAGTRIALTGAVKPVGR
jgi:hypothetical protein